NYTIAEGFHIYGLNKVEGPIATAIRYDSIPFSLLDIGQPKPHFDEGFQVNVNWYSGSGRFLIEVPSEQFDLQRQVTILYQLCTESFCYPPKETAIALTESKTEFKQAENISADFSYTAIKNQSFWGFILFAISTGFLALLTPCVFPMIPITVSFFTKHAEATKKDAIKFALFYGLGIVLTFTGFGFLVSVLFGAPGVQNFAANPIVNLFIGLTFIAFALSLFGIYDIQLPNSWLNKVNKLGLKPGKVGLFFAGVAFALVSFTCTVQFVGLLLVQATHGDWLYPLFGMLVFSAAFASPFVLLAIFPQLIAQMPKSGGWLHATKIVMAFVEIAAAFKFFSQSDLVWDLELLTRPVLLCIWIILFVLTALYLFGLIKLSDQDKVNRIGFVRTVVAAFFLFISVYLISGLGGKPLQADIDSYLPPMEYGTKFSFSSAVSHSESELDWIENYEQGLEAAKQSGKLIFIDFTGKTCTNCRWMEKNMFTRPEIESAMKKFTLLRLWTDFGEQKEFNQNLQLNMFQTVAQPYYAIIDTGGKLIRSFPGMTRNANDFESFLK
ncbi:MAG: thioredoxin family protein, partial [Calditrichaeota bacterium]|nr:thioredoxin family protein [Calditrichota bacterium]